MPIIPDYAGVPGDVHLYPHEYSQETAALPSGFRVGVGWRDATLVHDTHGYPEQLSAISPANGFLSPSQDPCFLPHTSQAQGHLFDTHEDLADQSLQDAARQFPPYYGASDFSPTQDAQTDLSFQGTVPPLTDSYGASEFFYTGNGHLLEGGGPNFFSATPTPVPTFAPIPPLSFDASTPGSTVGAPTPVSNFGALTPAPSFRAPPFLQSQAAEKQPPVAIDRAPRSSRTSVTPKLYHCSYVHGCKKTFKRKRECTRHMETVHLKPRENGMGNYVCECLKVFVRKDNLTRHLKKWMDLGTCTLASGPGYFVCQCRTAFGNVEEFDVHIKDCGAATLGRPTNESRLEAAPGAGAAESMG